jgi:hypothetical protein
MVHCAYCLQHLIDEKHGFAYGIDASTKLLITMIIATQPTAKTRSFPSNPKRESFHQDLQILAVNVLYKL